MNHVPHILVVDDDSEIRQMLADYLQRNGLRVSQADGGRAMRALMDTHAVDLVVLDVMMPGEDGLSLCRNLRAGKHRAVPVVLLTARDDETDRIIGLEMGADDYVTKPFSSRELLARITAVIRRTRMLPPNLQVSEAGRQLAFGEWRLDTTARHLLDAQDTAYPLSGAEFRLLRVFLDHANRVLSRDQLLSLTQGRDAELFDRSIDLLVSRVRQRLGMTRASRPTSRPCAAKAMCSACRCSCWGRTNEHRRTPPRWPRTLSARLLLVLLGGLALAHALSFGLLFFERDQSTRSMMLRNLDEDVAVSVALLEHLPADQRAAWVPRLERRTYRYLLRPAAAGPGLQTDRARQVTTVIDDSLQHRYPLQARQVARLPERFEVELRLHDGTP